MDHWRQLVRDIPARLRERDALLVVSADLLLMRTDHYYKLLGLDPYHLAHHIRKNMARSRLKHLLDLWPFTRRCLGVMTLHSKAVGPEDLLMEVLGSEATTAGDSSCGQFLRCRHAHGRGLRGMACT